MYVCSLCPECRLLGASGLSMCRRANQAKAALGQAGPLLMWLENGGSRKTLQSHGGPSPVLGEHAQRWVWLAFP